MREYMSEAIILNKQPNGNMDMRYAIFTRKFGKMFAKATSSRKLTSKLAGHLEPGTVSRVRLIEQHGLRVVDALQEGNILTEEKNSKRPTLHDLALLDRLLAESEPEPLVWAMVQEGNLDWRLVLRLLGWDPGEAVCSVCSANPVAGFSVIRQDFFCVRCAVRIPRYELVMVS
jgi:recombinational DNA repair protein (RecF pathway)